MHKFLRIALLPGIATRLRMAPLVLCMALALGFPAYGHAPPRVAIVVLLRPATLDDWRSAPAPNLHRLLEVGASTVVNTRAARVPGDRGRESVESAALTLGAGARAACAARDGAFTASGAPAFPGVTLFHGSQAPPGITPFPGAPTALGVTSFPNTPAFPGVTAGALFERRTGVRAGGDALLALNWPRILAANRGAGYRVAPGALGAALRSAGVEVVATPGPVAPLVATDGDGMVTRTTPQSFFAAAPTHRIAAFLDAPEDWRDADQLIGAAAQYAASVGALLILLSPSVDDREYASGERLAPMVLVEPSSLSGLLTSRSTRTPGLVAATDFAPAVAAYFDAPLAGAGPSREFTRLPEIHSEAVLTSIQRCSWDQRQGMKLLPPFAVIAGILIVAVTILQIRGVHVTPAIILLPAVAIYTFAMAESPRDIFLFGVAPIVMLLGLRRQNGLKVFRWLCMLIWAVAVVHMLAPYGTLKYSLLGYSVIEGARYYGIGNEMMGALAGAVLVAATGVQSRWARRVMLVLVLATAAMVGWPQIGAKGGGVIISVGTLLVYFGSLRGVRWSAGRAALVMGAALAAVLAVALLDSHLNPGRQSHLGQAVTGLQRSGLGEWIDIATRKLAVEGRLLWHSAWAVLLWSALAGLAALRRGVGISTSAQAKPVSNSTRTNAVSQAGTAAILLSVAFNDAGAVAGALCATLLWTYASLMTKGSMDDLTSSMEPSSNS